MTYTRAGIVYILRHLDLPVLLPSVYNATVHAIMLHFQFLNLIEEHKVLNFII